MEKKRVCGGVICKMEIVNGIERCNGYWLDGVYCCDCDICNGGKCICNFKYWMSETLVNGATTEKN